MTTQIVVLGIGIGIGLIAGLIGGRIGGVLGGHLVTPGSRRRELSRSRRDAGRTTHPVEPRDLQDLDERLFRSQRMESAASLAGGIAHDFNNLLTGILGYTRLILERRSPDESIRQPLAAIERSATRAAELTAELLTFSRRAANRPVPDDLNRIVTETIEALRPELPPEISVEFHPDAALMKTAIDAARLRRALSQLCANAREAMPDGGRLTIETANRVISPDQSRDNLEARPGRFVALSVSDTGPGIPPEVRGRLFEPFSTTKRVGHGIGLGLATVYGTIKSHDGWIEVISDSGPGAAFIVYLPVWEPGAADEAAGDEAREPAAPGAPPREDYRPATAGPATILVADDESLVLALARDVLEIYGFRVVTARNGAEALQLFKERAGGIDLVLLDLTMPIMSGLECFQKMREIDPGVRVVVSSGYSNEGSASDVIRAGALEFVQKPYDINRLAQTITQALERPPRTPPPATG